MKKILLAALAITLVFSLAACAGKTYNPGGDSKAPSASQNGDNAAPSGNNGGEEENGAKTGSKTEADIKSLLEELGFSVHETDDENLLFGAKSALNGMKAGESLQFYFYPSDSAAASAKASVWDPSAQAMSLKCEIDGHIVYIGTQNVVAEYEAAK